jgi:hypothetical protein
MTPTMHFKKVIHIAPICWLESTIIYKLKQITKSHVFRATIAGWVSSLSVGHKEAWKVSTHVRNISCVQCQICLIQCDITGLPHGEFLL